ncbi:amidohydrolase family protein, partial [Candidatus Binatus sp.]|uniref:amidohydrolase family protein n=1 Tax=Candidatus Binatus sp. TaxID=2811406 RepID=UPI003F966530
LPDLSGRADRLYQQGVRRLPSSIIRGKHVITRALDRHRWEQIDDGAVLQRDGIISAIGSFDELSRANPDAPVIGTGEQALLPGFVNGHHHVGLTPVQLGSPDMPLELWFATRLVTRDPDLYLDTLYSAFEMISSGITTVQHIHGWMPGKLAEVEERSESVIRAYEDIGMRVSYCFALRDLLRASGDWRPSRRSRARRARFAPRLSISSARRPWQRNRTLWVD